MKSKRTTSCYPVNSIIIRGDNITTAYAVDDCHVVVEFYEYSGDKEGVINITTPTPIDLLHDIMTSMTTSIAEKHITNPPLFIQKGEISITVTKINYQ